MENQKEYQLENKMETRIRSELQYIGNITTKRMQNEMDKNMDN